MGDYQFRLEQWDLRSVKNSRGYYDYDAEYTPIGKMSKKYDTLEECRAAARKYLITNKISTATSGPRKLAVIYRNGKMSAGCDLACYGGVVTLFGSTGVVVVGENGRTFKMRSYGGMYH